MFSKGPGVALEHPQDTHLTKGSIATEATTMALYSCTPSSWFSKVLLSS